MHWAHPAAAAQELVVDGDRGGPGREASLKPSAEAQQRDSVRAVRVDRLRQRRCVDARVGARHVMVYVPVGTPVRRYQRDKQVCWAAMMHSQE